MAGERVEKLENVAQTLRTRQWWAYDSFGVVYGDWRLTIDRKPNVYRPFLFVVEGVKRIKPFVSHKTCKMRYKSIDAALLHIFNEFCDHKAEKRFHTLDEAISKLCVVAQADSQQGKALAGESGAFHADADDSNAPAWWKMRQKAEI